MALRFDLQSHSYCSDGALAPSEVVRLAAAAGVELLALSDHDTVEGVEEALGAGARAGVRVIPASEISAVHDGAEDLHVLGYGLDHSDAELLGRLRAAREDRVTRAERMVARLRELGLVVDEERLAALRAAGRPLGRPHIAAAALAPAENAERLAAEGIADATTLLVAYLIPGAPAYVARDRPTVAEAIGWIHDAGGLAVWAHPFWDLDSGPAVVETIDAFAAEGLDGVEAFYPTHSPEQARLIARHCRERGLLITGSSDFHGPDHPVFSRFLAHDLHGLEPDLGRLAG